LNSCEFTKNLAELVKYHHVYYSEKKELNSRVGLLSDIIHLADRVDVRINYKHDLLEQKNAVCAAIQDYSGNRFNPEVVKCFLSLARQESFWFDLQFNSNERYIKKWIYYNPLLTLEQIHDIAKLFTKLIDFRSRFTATHSTSVAMIAKELGKILNLSERECLMLDIAGHLHDIGKLAIPISILEKPDKLDPIEWQIMKRHTYFTFQILDEIDNPVFKVINEWASLHHERMDGKGYPFKMPGDSITLGSRILAVADMFTALAESRPYREAMDDDILIDVLKKSKDSALDSCIIDTTIANYDYLKNIRKNAFCDALIGFEDLFDKK
ncbi:MAG: HD domain-containing phosphohydrolase, partial [Spirochaetota bacterium]